MDHTTNGWGVNTNQSGGIDGEVVCYGRNGDIRHKISHSSYRTCSSRGRGGGVNIPENDIGIFPLRVTFLESR